MQSPPSDAETMTTTMTPRRRLPRLLCLHGAGSNNDITPYQTGGLRLSQRFECIYLHAPHEMNRCYPGLARFSSGPWYYWGGTDAQWDESLRYIAEFCRSHGPFDGVYCFSQGTAIVTDMSHPKSWRDAFGMERPPWRFAILACGGGSWLVKNVVVVAVPKDDSSLVGMPSFHIHGRRDPHLRDSMAMTGYWDASMKRVVSHGSGHEIDLQMWSREKELFATLNVFLDEQLLLSSVDRRENMEDDEKKVSTD